jgi:uncharacterized protein (DUF488 family)
MATIYTIGHSTRSQDELIGLLREHSVDVLIDVRAIPRSRHNPQFNQETLAGALKHSAIAYRNPKVLGGMRAELRGVESPNLFWKPGGFRNFADYAMTPLFRVALGKLEDLAAEHCPAIMCAEAHWTNCHRRIITDYLLADGFTVVHIVAAGKTERAEMTPAAVRTEAGALLYPGDPATPRLPGL